MHSPKLKKEKNKKEKEKISMFSMSYVTWAKNNFLFYILLTGKSSIISETQHPEGLQKIQMLEDYSRYKKCFYNTVL